MARALMHSSRCGFVSAFERWWVHSMARAGLQVLASILGGFGMLFESRLAVLPCSPLNAEALAISLL